MTDLIERLRKPIATGADLHTCWKDRKEAADEIERLEAENNVLKRVANAALRWRSTYGNHNNEVNEQLLAALDHLDACMPR